MKMWMIPTKSCLQKTNNIFLVLFLVLLNVSGSLCKTLILQVPRMNYSFSTSGPWPLLFPQTGTFFLVFLSQTTEFSWQRCSMCSFNFTSFIIISGELPTKVTSFIAHSWVSYPWLTSTFTTVLYTTKINFFVLTRPSSWVTKESYSKACQGLWTTGPGD